MKKKYVLWFFAAVLVSMTVSLLRAQPDTITLNHGEAYRRKQRPPVVFPHEVHMAGDLSCTDCHHQYDNGENILDESKLEEGNPEIRCSHCHDRHARIELRQAFHRQCVGCHRRTQKKGEETGPRLCGQCHRRS